MIVLKVYNTIYPINNIFRISIIPAKKRDRDSVFVHIIGSAMNSESVLEEVYSIECKYSERVANELIKYLAEVIATEKSKCIDLVKLVGIIEKHVERVIKYESAVNR